MNSQVIHGDGGDVLPFGEIGADVLNCDLGNLQEAEERKIFDAIGLHLVLRFRDQSISDDEQLKLSELFAPLAPIPRVILGRAPWFAESPMLETISNVTENGQAIGSLGAGELSWHSDVPYIDRPYGICILRAIELPPTGGNTEFVNMYRVREALPEELATTIKPLKLRQSGTLTRGGKKREATAQGETQDIEAAHALIQKHPQSGREFLFLGRRQGSQILGLSESESEDLLDMLWAHLEESNATWEQTWRPEDVVLWDNRYTMHRRQSFDPASRRVLRRTSSVG